MPARTRLGLAAALLASAALAAPALALPGVAEGPGKGGPRTDKASSSDSSTQTVPCSYEDGTDAGTSTYGGPAALWPPNHQYVPGTATWTATDPEDTVTVDWTASHDQADADGEAAGSGNTQDDITPATGMMVTDMDDEVVQQFLVRAERAGTEKAGRTYTIAGTMTVMDTNMSQNDDMDMEMEEMTASCPFTFTIVVPHDQGRTRA